MKRKRDLSDLTPPGAKVSRYLIWYFVCLGLAVFITFFAWRNVSNAYFDILGYDMATDTWFLNTQAVMEDFAPLVMPCFMGFWGVAILCVVGIFVNRGALRRDSMSVYLLKRLPTKGEYLRRTAALPLIGLLLTLAVAVILVFLYYFIYMKTVPEECLAPDQLTRLYEYLFDRAAYMARVRS